MLKHVNQCEENYVMFVCASKNSSLELPPLPHMQISFTFFFSPLSVSKLPNRLHFPKKRSIICISLSSDSPTERMNHAEIKAHNSDKNTRLKMHDVFTFRWKHSPFCCLLICIWGQKSQLAYEWVHHIRALKGLGCFEMGIKGQAGFFPQKFTVLKIKLGFFFFFLGYVLDIFRVFLAEACFSLLFS